MRPIILALGVVLIGLGVALRAVDPQPVQTLRLIYFDTLQQAAPREKPDVPVRVIDIDEASLAEIGQWPWPRTILADLVDALDDLGAAVITFDILFAEPDRYSPVRLLNDPSFAEVFREGTPLSAEASVLDNDVRFAQAIASRRVVLGISETLGIENEFQYDKGGFVEVGETPTGGLFRLSRATPLLAVLDDAAEGVGSINVSPLGRASTVRTVPLVWGSGSGPIPSLSVEALRVALGETTYLLHGSQDIRGVMEGIQVGEFFAPTSDDGSFWLRYRPDDPHLYVSAADVLDAAQSPALKASLEGAIVLVGTSAPGLLDIRTTSLGENVPGVSIHAQIIEQILLGDFLYRSDLTAGLEITAFVALGLIVTLVMAKFGAVATVTAGLISAVALSGFGFYAFMANGVLFDVTFPLVGGALNFGALAGYQFLALDREKRTLRGLFSHYVSPSVLQQMENDGYAVELGGENRNLTIMFMDIRDFTSLSETLDPNELITLLNGLFTTLTQAILKQQGTVDKYMGDAIMAFWNAPLPQADHQARACLAMLDMRQALNGFNALQERDGKPPIAIAMGCATGEACVGNLGSTERFNYSAIGDTVNTAARVETSCRSVGYDIVVMRDTATGASDIATLSAGAIAAKGKSTRLPIEIVVGGPEVAKSPAFAALKTHHQTLMKALASGATRNKAEQLISLCVTACHSVDPALAQFYSRVLDRREDFRN